MDFESVVMTFAIACGIAGVVYALIIAAWVNKQDAGNESIISSRNLLSSATF